MNNIPDPKRELIRLSRLAKISGTVSFLMGAFVIYILIIVGAQEGMNLVLLLVSGFVGYGWYKSIQMFYMSKDMLQFSSFEEYVKHLEEEAKKED